MQAFVVFNIMSGAAGASLFKLSECNFIFFRSMSSQYMEYISPQLV